MLTSNRKTYRITTSKFILTAVGAIKQLKAPENTYATQV